ncbi:MAG TPA: hypothetical protein VLT58_12425, partial [Polyangia bacterium]|nr:hypothetical protein [Polyangia bacterium]
MKLMAARLRWAAVAVLLSLGSSLAGCAGFFMRDDVEWARGQWTANRDSRRAAAYAEALHDAFVAGAYTDRLADFARRADEALAA